MLLPIAVLALALQAPVQQEIAFTSHADGTTQQYILLLPEGFDPAQPHHLMVALHSYGGDRWQFTRPNYPTTRATLETMKKWNMIAVMPEYRGPKSWMGPKAETDVVQVIEEVKSRHKIGKTFVCGTSMGGTAALTFTTLHPGMVDGVIAFNAVANHLEFNNIQESIRESFGGGKQEVPLEYKNRSAEYFPERFTMPVAFTAGGKDTLIPPDSVARLAGILKKLNPKVLLILRPEEEHNTRYEDAMEAFDFVLKAVLSPVN